MLAWSQSGSKIQESSLPSLLTVRLGPHVTNGFISSIPQLSSTPGGIAGLLFGTYEASVVTVNGSRAFPDISSSTRSSRRRLDQLFENLVSSCRVDPELSSSDCIGWYSLRGTGGLYLNDIDFHKRHFHRPSNIALIVAPDGDMGVRIQLYAGSENNEFTLEEHRSATICLPRDTRSLGSIETTVRAKINDRVFLRAYEICKSIETAENRQIWNGIVSGTKKRRAVPLAVAFLILASIAIFMHSFPVGNRIFAFWPSASPAFDLHAERSKGMISLTWSRLNPVVRSAHDAVLRIDDGGKRRIVHLNARQAQNGSVEYKPATDDVTFQLEMHGRGGANISTNMRVLGGENADTATSRNAGSGLAVLPDTATRRGAKIDPSADTHVAPPVRDERSGRVSQSSDVAEHFTHAATGALASALPQTGSRSVSLSRPAISMPVTPAANIGSYLAPSYAPGYDVFDPIVSSAKLAAWNSASLPPPASTALGIGASQTRQTLPNLSGDQSGKTPMRNMKTTVVTQNGGPIYVPPKPLRQVLPNLKGLMPGIARSVKQIEIAVRVDKEGKVRAAHLADHEPKLPSAFVDAALSAARQWRFTPATLRSVRIESDHVIVFQFETDGR